MKLVVPVHNKRISPVFDWCMRMMLIDSAPGRSPDRREIDISWLAGIEKAQVVADSGAHALLCGGISSQLAGALAYHGVDVVSWIHGNADEIVEKFIDGTFSPGDHLMPGITQFHQYKTDEKRTDGNS